MKRLEQFRFHNGGVGLSRKSVGSFVFVFMLVSACTRVRLSVFGRCGGGGGGGGGGMIHSCSLPVCWTTVVPCCDVPYV